MVTPCGNGEDGKDGRKRGFFRLKPKRSREEEPCLPTMGNRQVKSTSATAASHQLKAGEDDVQVATVSLASLLDEETTSWEHEVAPLFQQSWTTRPSKRRPLSGSLKGFLSSTFRDTLHHREQLRQQVIGPLEERCMKSGVVAVMVDFRWGVTAEESASGQVIELCLSTIDQCDYFFGLLTYRYGWCLATVEGAEDSLYRKTLERACLSYPWVKASEYWGRSATELEMEHGFVRSPAGKDVSDSGPFRWAFFVQEPTESILRDGEATRITEIRRLRDRVLRRAVEAKAPILPMRSPREFSAAFESVVDEFLKVDLPTRSDENRLDTQSDAFRLTLIRDYVPVEKAHSFFASWLSCDTMKGRVVCVYGEKGAGKSSLLAGWHSSVNENNSFRPVFRSFNANSSSLAVVLRSIVIELNGTDSLIKDDEAFIREWSSLIPKKDRERAIVFLDALDQLPVPTAAERLAIAKSLVDHCSCKLVVSMDNMSDFDFSSAITPYKFEAFDPLKGKEMIVSFLKRHHKSLSHDQSSALGALANGPLLCHGMGVSLLREELKSIKSFEEVQIRLSQLRLVSSLPALYNSVMQRLEEEYGVANVALVCKLVTASRAGLTLSELGVLLKDVPLLHRRGLLNGLSYVLPELCGYVRVGHRIFREVISNRYRPGKEDNRALADFFAHSEETNTALSVARVFFEGPHQLLILNSFEELQSLLGRPSIIIQSQANAATRQDACTVYGRLSTENNSPIESFILPLCKESNDGLCAASCGHLLYMSERWNACSEAYDHCISLLDCQESERDVLCQLAQVFHQNALAYAALDNREHAIVLYQRSIALKEDLYGQDAVELAPSLTGLGILKRELGQHSEALDLLQRALKIQQESLGSEHSELAVTLTNIGIVLQELGDYADGLSYFQRSTEINNAVFGTEHAQVGISLTNVGNVLYELGKMEEALSAYKEALRVKELVFGPDHTETAITLTNIGNTYLANEDYSSALEMYKRSAKIQERTYGKAHSELALTLSNMGVAEKKLGNLDAAFALYQRSLEIDEQVFSPDHPSVAGTLTNMGTVKEQQGEVDEALRLYTRAIDIKERAYGPRHPSVAVTLVNVGIVKAKLAQKGEALSAMQRALDAFHEAFGPEHPHTAKARHLLDVISSLDVPTPAENVPESSSPQRNSDGAVEETKGDLSSQERKDEETDVGKFSTQ